MKNKLKTVQTNDYTIKLREPEIHSGVNKVILMLHGYTGDETSMWVFSNKLPRDAMIISPRAPFPSTDQVLGGFTWVDQSIMHWPTHQDFFKSASYLDDLLEELAVRYTNWNFYELSLVGFSQGGAMAIVFASSSKRIVSKIALLSSFLPDGSEGFLRRDRFTDLDVFIGHGEMDDIVPVEKARYANEILRNVGTNTTVCISPVGHQLGSDCFSAFGKFFSH